MAFLNDVVTVLEGGSVGVFGVDIYLSTMVAISRIESGAILVLFDTGGASPDGMHTHTNAPAFTLPGGQLVARGNDYPSAAALLQRAYDTLYPIRNQIVNNAFYWYMRPTSEILDLRPDERGNARASFNILGKRRTLAGGDTSYSLVDIFGGDQFAFVRPTVIDTYPAGSGSLSLVPDSWTITLSTQTLVNVVLEASARVENTGARAKVALVDLDANTIITEIAFTTGELNGETKRSGSITLVDPHRYGVKMTTNSVTIGSAVWGARLLKV